MDDDSQIVYKGLTLGQVPVQSGSAGRIDEAKVDHTHSWAAVLTFSRMRKSKIKQPTPLDMFLLWEQTTTITNTAIP